MKLSPKAGAASESEPEACCPRRRSDGIIRVIRVFMHCRRGRRDRALQRRRHRPPRRTLVPRVSRFERCVINLNSFASPPGRRGTSIYSSESVRLGFEVGNLSLAGPDLIASHNPGRDGLAGTVASVSRRTTFKVKLES